MSEGSRHRFTITAALSLIALTAACSSSAGSTGTSATGSSATAPQPPVSMPVPPSTALKELHNTRTAGTTTALDRGLLTYSPLSALPNGATTDFTVTVFDIGSSLQLTSAPTKYRGAAVDPYDVPAAADVAVQIICTGSLACQSENPQSGQPVNRKQEGHWTWAVTGSAPGTGVIGIVAVTYRNGSDTLLHATPVWTVPVTVKGP